MLSSNNIKLDSTAFPDAGIYVMRSERIYLAAVCHKIGVNGIGPHKHNDWLSFELCVDGKPVIVDPGTYCYTGNMEMRRLFRSTAYHNTVVIDREEQITLHNSMFGLSNPSGDIKVLCWESDKNSDVLEAEHTGYARLQDPVVHRRRFVLDKQKHLLEITDNFTGHSTHILECYLHFDTELNCDIQGQGATISKDDAPILKLDLLGWNTEPAVKQGWVSKAYNQYEKAEMLCWRYEGKLGSSKSFVQHLTLWNC